jgi:hypothetical protein
METEKTGNITDTFAKIISVVFHPLFMPVYGLLIIFSAPTLFGYLPFQVKKLLLLIVVINNVMLPFSLMPFFIHRNIISTWTIENRRERVIPLILTTILYSVTSFIIFRLPIPLFLKTFIFSTFFLSIIVTVINFWWKISLHSVASGAIIALVLILSFKMFTPLTGYLIISVIVGGLVLSSRLRLNYHNPLQVWMGFLAGIFGLSLFMMLF